MKIKGFKINGFGKLKNKQIELSDGINIIYGKNETGKSSILKFISSMLYGASKNKNGKELSDFDRYKPWQTEEFSGKMEYELDNGETFEVYREFKKKNPIIYNAQKEDISKEFNVDKTKGINFFFEQTGIDEETFYSTAITEQEGVKLSRTSQSSIVQKISNLISSGDDNVSFKKSLEKINKNQNEEIGTERTSQRPINLTENKIRRLIEERRSLEINREKIADSELKIEQLKLDKKSEEIKIDFLKEIKNNLDNNRLKNAEINFNKNLENEYNQKITELNKKIENSEHNKENEKISFKNYYIILAIFIITFIVLMLISTNKVWNLVLLIPIIIILLKKHKVEKKIKENLQSRDINIDKIINEIEILKQNKEAQKNDANQKLEKLNSEIEKENIELTDKFIDRLDYGFIQENLNKNYDAILREIDIRENRLNTIKFKLHTLENDFSMINEKLENLSKIEEELQVAEQEKEELLTLNNSYNIAKECLERAYNQVKQNISPRFVENLSDIIAKVSDNRYNNIVFSDEEGLNVEIENGNYMPASRLSVGTIDQMYLSLRLSSLNEISDEKLPIILDEAFAYFDDTRLRNFLRYLSVNFKDNQVIIFSCTDREEEILKELNVSYTISKL